MSPLHDERSFDWARRHATCPLHIIFQPMTRLLLHCGKCAMNRNDMNRARKYVRQTLLMFKIYYSHSLAWAGFRSVVVITCASHAQGPRFEPGRKQVLFLIFNKVFHILKQECWLVQNYKEKKQLYISLLVSVWRIICENFNPNQLLDEILEWKFINKRPKKNYGFGEA